MEEGSLLQIALERSKELSTTRSTCEPPPSSSLEKNCLILDLYSLTGSDLFHLADLASYCNKYIQSKDYLWHYGADGPVFGIHIENSSNQSVPHLRSYCRYGPCVQDEWMAIYFILELTKAVRKDNKGEVAALVWDVQDGQVIFIQLSDLLPTWLDEDPTDSHRYACWIQDGTIQIFRHHHITLIDALDKLKRRQNTQYPRIQRAFIYWLEINMQACSVHQRTPMVLPRTVAHVFHKRPELLPAAIQAFCDHVQEDVPPTAKSETIEPDIFKKYEDWVWTLQILSKTNYAMARTVASPRREGSWLSSSDSVPIAAGVEVKRFQRQCNIETKKHLKYAMALGLRAVTGLELLTLLGTDNDSNGIFSSSTTLSSLQERIVYWDRIEQDYKSTCVDNNVENIINNKCCILENFQKGPSNTEIDLSNILTCPVFPEEAQNWTSFSCPDTSIRDQIKSIMKLTYSENNNDNENMNFSIPRADQIDTDGWMDYEERKSDKVGSIESQNDLDNLLSRFQLFLKQTSDVEGVVTDNSNDNSNGTEKDVISNTIDIRPRVFLNILQSVLKDEKLEFPTVDPYFYHEDYDLMEGDSDDDDDDGDLKENNKPYKLKDIMNAMDNELEERADSRGVHRTQNTHNEGNDVGDVSIDEDAQILSNLIQSLDASGGESGPVTNIIKGMEDISQERKH